MPILIWPRGAVFLYHSLYLLGVYLLFVCDAVVYFQKDRFLASSYYIFNYYTTGVESEEIQARARVRLKPHSSGCITAISFGSGFNSHVLCNHMTKPTKTKFMFL